MSGIRPGQDWGSPATGAPDVEVAGDDAALAAAVGAGPADPLVRFVPAAGSDVARAVGLDDRSPRRTALPLDALALAGGRLVCNMAVLGTPPDRLRWWTAATALTVAVDGVPVFAGRATGVVIATGEFLRGHDLAPRGHPGDGRAEVQVYAARRSERRGLRARLTTGTHVPHPRVTQRAGTHIEIRAAKARPLELDGAAAGRVEVLIVRVVPRAYRLLV
jgi:hypothetical protein